MTALRLWQTASQLEGPARGQIQAKLCKEAGAAGAREEEEQARSTMKLEIAEGPGGKCKDLGFCSV